MIHRKFRVDIILIFTLLMLSTAIGIVYVVYSHNETMAIDNASRRLTYESKIFTEKVNYYMITAQSATDNLAKQFSPSNRHEQNQRSRNAEQSTSDTQPRTDRQQASLAAQDSLSTISMALLKTLVAYKQFGSIAFGNSRAVLATVSYQGQAGYELKTIRTAGGYTLTTDIYDAKSRLQKQSTTTGDIVNDRWQAWYKQVQQTGKIFWSKPYRLSDSNKFGVTVNAPVFDSSAKLTGMVATTIPLNKISEFLLVVKLSRNGIAFVSDGAGKLLAFFSSQQNISYEAGQDIADLQLPQIIAAAKTYSGSTDNLCRSFSVANKKFLTTCQPLAVAHGQQWMLTIIAPQNDFTGALATTLKRILYLSAVALVAGILISLLLARRISKPIELLAKDILEIRNFNFDSELSITSPVQEIQTMHNAIKAMKNNLQAFSLYLPALLVKQLIKSGETIAIGGKEQELTIFFSDIEQFTSISENHPPHELLVQLSDYFDATTAIIDNEYGTVDKFIGDAVMAFWGAPLPNQQHAVNACRAALRCQQKIKELNRQWIANGQEPFNTRIGIHSSQVIVGNIGAKQRMNYTVLGDGVNLASRLEGVNKIYRTEIIISQATYDRVQEHFICRILDEITVKGQEQSIVIYELLAEINAMQAPAKQELAVRFNAIYQLYRTRQWREALQLLYELLEIYPGDNVCSLYVRRCKKYLKTPPASNWAGVSRLQIK